MDIISKHRGEGKTIDLIKISAEKQIPILTTTRIQANFILLKAMDMGLTIPQPLVCNLASTIFPSVPIVLIDDLDFFLESLLNCQVHTATTTKKITLTRKTIANHFGLTEDDFDIVE